MKSIDGTAFISEAERRHSLVYYSVDRPRMRLAVLSRSSVQTRTRTLAILRCILDRLPCTLRLNTTSLVHVESAETWEHSHLVVGYWFDADGRQPLSMVLDADECAPFG
jgi:hypothetical protein